MSTRDHPATQPREKLRRVTLLRRGPLSGPPLPRLPRAQGLGPHRPFSREEDRTPPHPRCLPSMNRPSPGPSGNAAEASPPRIPVQRTRRRGSVEHPSCKGRTLHRGPRLSTTCHQGVDNACAFDTLEPQRFRAFTCSRCSLAQASVTRDPLPLTRQRRPRTGRVCRRGLTLSGCCERGRNPTFEQARTRRSHRFLRSE